MTIHIETTEGVEIIIDGKKHQSSDARHIEYGEKGYVIFIDAHHLRPNIYGLAVFTGQQRVLNNPSMLSPRYDFRDGEIIDTEGAKRIFGLTDIKTIKYNI